MKKMWFVLCALLLIPTLALASGDMVSISELRQQVEAMGRWTKTYEAYGRTIEVDVPIIVPEVEKMPIVMIEPWRPYDEESWLPHQKIVETQELGGDDNFNSLSDVSFVQHTHHVFIFINCKCVQASFFHQTSCLRPILIRENGDCR